MDTAVAISIGLIIGGLLKWGHERYLLMKADGKVTLDEIVDAVKDGADKITEAADAIEDAKGDDEGGE